MVSKTLTARSDPDNMDQEQFDRLLHWLNPDREQAGAEYEAIRRRLIKMFVCRGSRTPEELADKTINRVARKLLEIQELYVGEPAHYFCSVANYIWHEALRKEKVPAIGLPSIAASEADSSERRLARLEQCIEKLPAADRELVLAYYQQEKHAKIEHRRKLAEQLGLGMNALRIRACRIRASLQKSMERAS